MTRTLVGVGVGPGDPELVTVKGVRRLREADVVFVPVMTPDKAGRDSEGRAERSVRHYVDGDVIRRVGFALDDRDGVTPRRLAAWDVSAQAVVDAFEAGAQTVCFATIGDPAIYSTFSYLAEGVRQRLADVVVETVPGITAMQDLASRSGMSLCEGTESLVLVPLTGGTAVLADALATHDCVVAYKSGRHLPAVIEVLRAADRLDGAVYGAALGLPDEDIRPLTEVTSDPPYLSTVIVPARRSTRGGRL